MNQLNESNNDVFKRSRNQITKENRNNDSKIIIIFYSYKGHYKTKIAKYKKSYEHNMEKLLNKKVLCID